jgi:hypothetical protein
VVDDQIEDDPDAERVGAVHERHEVAESAVRFVPVVRDV